MKMTKLIGSSSMSNLSSTKEIEELSDILAELPNQEQLKIRTLLYGKLDEFMPLPNGLEPTTKGIEIRAHRFKAKAEELRPPRIVKVGIFQHQLPLPTSTMIKVQREALFKMAEEAIKIAAEARINIFCFPETWNMPFAFCTKSKSPWSEFAESAEHGPTTLFLKELAKRHNMVIISPIMERDETHGETLWNSAVVIDNSGDVLGKHRKNHIPKVEGCSEPIFFAEGNLGHPVFQTEFGKIAINICYGRHHPLNWLMFGLNGAEIVFNPSATDGDLSESIWAVEARSAAIANSYFVCAVNRVGTENFEGGTGGSIFDKAKSKDSISFYGSSYVAAPDGSRSPGLPRKKKALLISELDLNLCRQAKDEWGFQTTQRLDLYVETLIRAAGQDFKPQIIKKA